MYVWRGCCSVILFLMTSFWYINILLNLFELPAEFALSVPIVNPEFVLRPPVV